MSITVIAIFVVENNKNKSKVLSKSNSNFNSKDISANTFWKESFVHGCFITGTFQFGNFLAWGIFSTRNFLGPWTFWEGIFQHITFRHKNFSTCVTVPICPCPEMSSYKNVPVPKIPRAKFPCQKVCLHKRQIVHALKCFCDETSATKQFLPKSSTFKCLGRAVQRVLNNIQWLGGTMKRQTTYSLKYQL